MGDEKQGRKKRVRQKQTYQYHKNAVSISVYDPMAQTIPANVREELANSVWKIAQEHKLLINIADE